jgi:hypothetical protein
MRTRLELLTQLRIFVLPTHKRLAKPSARLHPPCNRPSFPSRPPLLHLYPSHPKTTNMCPSPTPLLSINIPRTRPNLINNLVVPTITRLRRRSTTLSLALIFKSYTSKRGVIVYLQSPHQQSYTLIPDISLGEVMGVHPPSSRDMSCAIVPLAKRNDAHMESFVAPQDASAGMGVGVGDERWMRSARNARIFMLNGFAKVLYK